MYEVGVLSRELSQLLKIHPPPTLRNPFQFIAHGPIFGEEKRAKIMHAFFSKLDNGRSDFTESNP